MDTIYALILNGIVKNKIVADANFISGISGNYDFCINITSLDPNPSIGWLYDGTDFENPQKTYAKVNANLVTEIALIHNDDLAFAQEQNQYVVLIENLDPMPGLNWSYDGSVFTAP